MTIAESDRDPSVEPIAWQDRLTHELFGLPPRLRLVVLGALSAGVLALGVAKGLPLLQGEVSGASEPKPGCVIVNSPIAHC